MTREAGEELRTEFNEWARAGKGESMERGHRPVGEQAIARMAVGTDARVLDVGCGSGWATRLLAESAFAGSVTGIDISDEMIRVARESSEGLSNVYFEVATAEQLPFSDNSFTHAFSMESLYYYRNIPKALKEIHRVLTPAGLFVAVVDLYWENEPTHQWIDTLNVPVELLSTEDYRSLFLDAGFTNIRDGRLIDPRPVPDDYTGGSFKSHEDFQEYRNAGSLMISGEVAK
jgi:SAM-dependent methyltransferase